MDWGRGGCGVSHLEDPEDRGQTSSPTSRSIRDALRLGPAFVAGLEQRRQSRRDLCAGLGVGVGAALPSLLRREIRSVVDRFRRDPDVSIGTCFNLGPCPNAKTKPVSRHARFLHYPVSWRAHLLSARHQARPTAVCNRAGSICADCLADPVRRSRREPIGWRTTSNACPRPALI